MDSCISCTADEITSVCTCSDVDFSPYKVPSTEKKFYDEDDEKVRSKGATDGLFSEIESVAVTGITTDTPTTSRNGDVLFSKSIDHSVAESDDWYGIDPILHIPFLPRLRLSSTESSQWMRKNASEMKSKPTPCLTSISPIPCVESGVIPTRLGAMTAVSYRSNAIRMLRNCQPKTARSLVMSKTMLSQISTLVP